MAKDPSAEKTFLRNIIEQARFLTLAILVAVVIRSFAYEPFRIPSGSMLPTLLVGDYVFVSKFSYGYSRYSFPFGIVPIKNRIFAKSPDRGDVAVFRNPITPNIIYIKRIIGLPNDVIQVINGRLWINGVQVERDQQPDFEGITHYQESLPDGAIHSILETDGDTGYADNTRPYQVPAGHYFAMGDNRDNSQDSRFLSAVGFIPEANLVGKAQVTWLSLDGFGIRLNRFFKRID